MAQMNLPTEQKQLTDIEERLVVFKGEGVGWTGSLGLVDANLHLEWTSNAVLLYSTGNYIQSFVTDHDRR